MYINLIAYYYISWKGNYTEIAGTAHFLSKQIEVFSL